MSTMKKIGALIMALAMCFALAMPAFAAEETPAADTPAAAAVNDEGKGSITITNAKNDVYEKNEKGEQTGHHANEYYAYKIFDAVYTGSGSDTAVTYTVKKGAIKTAAEAANSPFNVATSADSNENYAVSLKTEYVDDDAAAIAAVRAWVKDHQSAFTEKTKLTITGSTATADGLPYGYYFVTSGVGATITLTSNTPDVEVVDKNTVNPGVHPDDPDDDTDNNGKLKQVVDAEKKVIAESDRTAQIGETLDFQIVFDATNFYTENDTSKQITSYDVVDVPNGFDLDKESVTVTVLDADKKVLAEPLFVREIADDGTLTVHIEWADKNNGDTTIYPDPSTVKINYKGTLNGDASDGDATNDAKVNINLKDDTHPDPVNPDPDPEDHKPDTPDVTVKTYKINLLKYDGADTNKAPLSGAEFRLFATKEDGSEGGEIAVVEDKNGGYRVATKAEIGENESGEVIKVGQADIKGLSGKYTYQLKEVKAPVGYNPLVENKSVVMNNTDQNCEVANNKGGVLPSTGGMGTTVFYVVGGAMVLGAGVLLITKKRMAE